MRILQVISDLHPRNGGPPMVVVGAAVALANRGHDVTIAARILKGDEVEVKTAWPSLQKSTVKLELYQSSAPNFLLSSRDFIATLEERFGDFDVVHFHGLWETMMPSAGRILKRNHIPYLISAHGMLDKWARNRSRWKKLLALYLLGARNFLDHASAIVYGTESEKNEAADLLIRGTARVIPNGISFGQFKLADPNKRKELHQRFPKMNKWNRTLLFYARIHPKKGLDILIDAFLNIADHYPSAGLFIAGISQDADYEANLRKQVKDSGFDDRIVFTNELTGNAGKIALSAADVFVLPSHGEGFSMAILEAMATGLPVLISDKCHFDEIQAANAGWVVRPDVEALSQAIREVLAVDPLLLQDMGKTARHYAETRYSWESVAAQLEAAYIDVQDSK